MKYLPCLAFFSAALLVASCKSGSSGERPFGAGPDVRIQAAVFQEFHGFHNRNPRHFWFWTNDVAVPLHLHGIVSNADLVSGKTNAYVFSVRVIGRDIYAAGKVLNPGTQKYDACYWKNGRIVRLETGLEEGSGASDIAVRGRNIYVIGSYIVNTGRWQKPVYCVWKNGRRTDVDSVEGFSDIRFDGEDYYAVGDSRILTWYFNNWMTGLEPCILKNDKVIVLPTTNGHGYTGGMLVTNGRVYVFGGEEGENTYKPQACYWEDGAIRRLKFSGAYAFVFSGAFQGTNLVLAGFYSDDPYVMRYRACYWYDGKFRKLDVPGDDEGEAWDGIETYATGVQVRDEDVYITGFFIENLNDYHGCYWKNGEFVELPAPVDTAFD